MVRHGSTSTTGAGAQTQSDHDPALDVNSIELHSLFSPSFEPQGQSALRKVIDLDDADLLRLATRLWPSSVFNSAKSVQSSPETTANISACSHSHPSHAIEHSHPDISPESQSGHKHVSKTTQRTVMQEVAQLP